MVLVTKCPKCEDGCLCNVQSHGHATCGTCEYECSTDEFYDYYHEELEKSDGNKCRTE